jgi:hypothetical protein
MSPWQIHPRCIVGGGVTLQNPRSAGARIVFYINNVLNSDRDASKRERYVRLLGLPQSSFYIAREESLNCWLHRLDARFEGTDDIHRAKGFCPKAFLNF